MKCKLLYDISCDFICYSFSKIIMVLTFVAAVKFLWDCTVESLERLKKEEGGGCILAHCMGLGKTLSVIAFVHTLMSKKKLTKLTKTLVVCPLNTVLNWQREWQKWFEDIDDDKLWTPLVSDVISVGKIDMIYCYDVEVTFIHPVYSSSLRPNCFNVTFLI